MVFIFDLVDIFLDLKDATQQLSDELKDQFPMHGVLDAMGVEFLQYWRDEKATKISFSKKLNAMKEHFGQLRWIGGVKKKRLIAPISDCF